MKSVSIKDINKLALPAIVSGIAEPIISLVDTSIVGHLGTNELGGIGIASSFFLLMIWVFSQTRSAISALVSKYYGKNQLEKIESLITQSVLINLLLGVVILSFTLPFSELIFKVYGAEGLLLEKAHEYFKIRALGFPIVLATFGLFGVFRGIQNTTWAMQISIIGGVVNLVLDIVFVYGIDGLINPMGVSGAALASLIAQLIMFVLAILFFLKKSKFVFLFTLKINDEIFNLLSMSTNFIIRTLALNVAYFLSNKLATGYGAEYIAAHTIAMNVWLFSAFFIDGYANAGNALSGRLLGEENYYELRLLGGKIAKISSFIGVLLALVYLIGYSFIVRLFTVDIMVIDVFNAVFWMIIISQPINGFAFGYDGIFKGLGEAKHLRNTLLLGTFLCFIPIVLIGELFELKLHGIWFAFIAWMIYRGGSLWWKFRKMYPQLP